MGYRFRDVRRLIVEKSNGLPSNCCQRDCCSSLSRSRSACCSFSRNSRCCSRVLLLGRGAGCTLRLDHPSVDRAHALLSRLPEGGFVVSVRAPLRHPRGADELCRRFPDGGGREAPAGINRLPDDVYDECVKAFLAAF